MELFKLLGTITIDNAEANKALTDTQKKAKETSDGIGKGNEHTKSSNKSTESSWTSLKSKINEYKAQGMTTSQAWRQYSLDMKSSSEDAGNGIVGSFKAVGAAIVAYLAVDKIIAFGKGCLTAAADAQAMESQFSQVFGDLDGKASQSLTNVANNAGISENRLKGSFTQIAAFAKTTGMDTASALSLSERAMVAVADSAAFYDRSIEDTTESLQSFLKGNYENDAALGLSCTETTRNAAANALYGKSFNELSESQKQLTLLQMVEDANKASGALGQAARESDTWTNVTGNLQQAWKDFQAVLGAEALPVAIGFVKGLADVVGTLAEKTKDAIQWAKEHETTMTLIGIAAGTLAVAIGAYTIAQNAAAIATAISTAATAAFGTVMAFVTSPITLVVAAIGALIAIGVLLYKNWDEIKAKCLELWGKLKDTWNNIKTAIVEKVEEIKSNLTEKWESIKTTVSEAVENVKNAISEKFTAAKEKVISIFDACSEAISKAWETIKNVVKVGLMFIVEVIKAAFNLITLPYRLIWENCKDIILKAWNAIKDTVTKAINAVKDKITQVWNTVKDTTSKVWDGIKSYFTAVWETHKKIVSTVTDAIKSVITKVWNAIKTVTTTIWDGIKFFFSTVWEGLKLIVTTVVDAIKSKITAVWDNIKSVTSTVFNAVKSVASSVWESIKNVISNVVNSVKSTVSNVWNSIKSTTSSVFNGIQSTASSVWNGIKNAISNAINTAKDKVKAAIDKMKSFFNFSWSLPKIKLPHFKISGKFSLDPPSVPKFSVSWYKKAMQNAMILNSPTIFGYSAASGQFLGGGEAGSEVVAGANTLMGMIGSAVEASSATQTDRMVSVLTTILEAIVSGNKEQLRELKAGHTIAIGGREFGRAVREYA